MHTEFINEICMINITIYKEFYHGKKYDWFRSL